MFTLDIYARKQTILRLWRISPIEIKILRASPELKLNMYCMLRQGGRRSELALFWVLNANLKVDFRLLFSYPRKRPSSACAATPCPVSGLSSLFAKCSLALEVKTVSRLFSHGSSRFRLLPGNQITKVMKHQKSFSK
jgi:hypothetical protein